MGGSGEERLDVVVDAAGYRDRRRRTLESLATRSAEDAVRTGLRVELEPMSAAERKIVHTTLQDNPHVTTTSEGDEPNRRVVVEPEAAGPGGGELGSVTHLDAWLRAVVETPGLTALDLDGARAMLVDDALRAVPALAPCAGPIVDVGSGNGSPGIPIALELPDREVVLLEAEARRCEFLQRWAPTNARVVRGRAEEQETDWAGAALAKALAPPPVAAEWCLPLVRPGGTVVLWVGESADLGAVARVAATLAAEPAESPDGPRRPRQDGPHPRRVPASPRSGQKAAVGVAAPSAFASTLAP